MLHQLAAAGVRHLFGNPGSTELPLYDALVDHEQIELILGLQEVPVMAMADGYAQASGGVGVANLHISCGLGNGMGMLYNAWRSGTPLVVTAGQQHRGLKFQEPILWSDMVQVARPWTKWAVEVERAVDLPLAVRRAVQTALSPPTGPVFLSIPLDVQCETGEFDLTPPQPVNPRVRPPDQELRRVASLLAAAENPGILVGSRVQEARAVEELITLAERLGAPVIHETGTTHGRLGFPCTHPLSAPGLPVLAPEIRARLEEFDVLFAVGLDVFRLYIYAEPANPLPDQTRLVHMDVNAWEIGKNHPVEVGIVGDLKVGLAELAVHLDREQSPRQKEAARARGRRRGEQHLEARRKLEEQAAARRGTRPLATLALMDAVARALPENVAVVEEAVTTTRTYLELVGAIKDPTGYFGHRGWALGWGLGCSLGVKLAWPHRPVLALLGEGAIMYGIQGLWTAARYGIPVTFVVCNNAEYQILKTAARNMHLPRAAEGRFAGMDLAAPEIDFVGLARALGIEAERVTEPEELTAKLSRSLAGNAPRLFDVPIERGGK
jgi:benzoylformate decarboxylase